MRSFTWSRTLKLFHIVGSTCFCAALIALILLSASLPDAEQVERFTMLRQTMGNVAVWLLLPSTGLVVVTGLFSMAISDTHKNAGWVWAKLATGVLILEGTLVNVQAPMQRAARDAQAALDGEFDLSTLGTTLVSEWYSFWIILGVAAANIVLAVYRPRFIRKFDK